MHPDGQKNPGWAEKPRLVSERPFSRAYSEAFDLRMVLGNEGQACC